MRPIPFKRYFTKQAPLSSIPWSKRFVEIKDGDKVVFSGDVEAPVFWSDLAVALSAKTWFRIYKHEGEKTARREDSIRSMIHRVTSAIAEASKHANVGHDYFACDEEARRAFQDELFHICVHQIAMFNTPVWVNVGVEKPKHLEIQSENTQPASGCNGVFGSEEPNRGPQASACFILEVADSMESLIALQAQETMLFRHGSGTGSNLSTLRPAGALLSSGGTASGPVSFMRGFDAWAGVTKSGGKSRRAAKMAILDVYHPDIHAFIQSKVTAQKMIRDLGMMGWSSNFNEVATTWIPYQNANNSVRVDDRFMAAALQPGMNVQLEFPTSMNKDNDVQPPAESSVVGPWVDAYVLLKEIAAAAHDCGDPALQYDSTINEWHTCKASGRISASNPCSEYMFLTDSACNLASLRLTQFLTGDELNPFDIEAFCHTARTMFIAQEILVGAAGYPTDNVAKNSRDFRPIGLGYADLGAFLMRLGIPYGSEEGQSICASLTALLGGVAYQTSAELSQYCGGPFPRFAENKTSMLNVIAKHKSFALELQRNGPTWLGYEKVKNPKSFSGVREAAAHAWSLAFDLGSQYGFRNAQATVLAPTGTIGFAMDCDTTGIEPDTAIVKIKKLAGGGMIEFVNRSVPIALQRLGYTQEQITDIIAQTEQTGRIPHAPVEKQRAYVHKEHLPVFATAFGENVVCVEDHLLMMASAQPFLSGAISKTVNLPSQSTVEDVMNVYIQAWKLKLKAVAIYRDNSKDQPLTAKGQQQISLEKESNIVQLSDQKRRRRLPVDCRSYRHKFSLGGVDGYIHIGFYENGDLGEIFVRMEPNAKSSILIDLTTQAASIAIQYGASIESLLAKWEGTEFAPSGFTGEGASGIAWASSPLDYLAKWLRKFLENLPSPSAIATGSFSGQQHGMPSQKKTTPPTCPRCFSALRLDGACWSCPTCGHGLGGCGG